MKRQGNAMFFKQVAPHQQGKRICRIRERHQTTGNHPGLPVSREQSAQECFPFAAQCAIEGLQPLPEGPLRRTQHIDHHEIERRVARFEHAVEQLPLGFERGAPGLDLHRDARLALLESVGQRAQRLRFREIAGKDLQGCLRPRRRGKDEQDIDGQEERENRKTAKNRGEGRCKRALLRFCSPELHVTKLLVVFHVRILEPIQCWSLPQEPPCIHSERRRIALASTQPSTRSALDRAA